MELDKRIMSGKKPLTALDTDVAKEFIGKQCYFADNIEDFFNLDNTNVLKGFLTDIDDDEMISGCFKSNGIRSSFFGHFIVPCEWVKEPEEHEKKYREYKDLDEFFDVTGLEIGDLIKLKFPGNNVAELLIVGSCDNGLFIGIHKYTFKQLFEMVEISISGEWQPFGVLDE